MNRRDFLRLGGVAGLALAARPLNAQSRSANPSARPIDRQAAVRRHNPDFRTFDPNAALSLGNGEFAFTADITGLQTFAAECEKDFPLCTAAHWAWHSTPAAPELKDATFKPRLYDTYGRQVPYNTSRTGQEPLYNYLRENPHKFHLGRLAFEFGAEGLAAAKPSDVANAHQTLDLWTGHIESRFEHTGKSVRVQTVAHPTLDAIAVRIESPLVASSQLRVLLAFPYGSPQPSMADWTQPERHTSTLDRDTSRRAFIARTLDETRYHVALTLGDGTEIVQRAPHEFVISAGAGTTIEFTCLFAAAPHRDALPDFATTASASAAHWEKFWSNGGFVDFGNCTDPRAIELERRTILSLYNTALHCAGSLPPAETGLLCNSWYGKFHLEMHWWHGVHFAAWNRFALFERSLDYYPLILPAAREIARSQGYKGTRWPKMTDASGRDSPSPIGPLLIWQQPHPIYYAELNYQARPERKTLEHWREVVFETAEFMSDYAHHDGAHDRFVLGPPLKTVPENTEQTKAFNPTFELAYWRFGLRVAQEWRQRLGLPREPRWDAVLAKLSPLPLQDGLYLLEEGLPDTYTKWNWEHPSHLGALGVQPGDGVDPSAMRATLKRSFEVWKWDECWGWDFPMVAMCAARSGEPELAVQALLIKSPKNLYHPNGHNYQRPGLTSYLPGNGGFLSAVGMMANGWTGASGAKNPGFPTDGRWNVHSEGLRTWL